MQTPQRNMRNTHLENVSNLSTPLHIPASPFMRSMGYGTGVSVFRLERSPKCGQLRSPWAVKRISQRARNQGQEVFNSRIQVEAEILRKLNHPNIVGFRGVTKAQDGVDSLALECCSTSLGCILEERNDEDLGPLPAENTLKMIVDIAKALDYLHTEAKILHGDIKSFNILVKGEFEICKLCDFGVSLPLDEDGVADYKKYPNLSYVGTTIWSAPEVIDEESTVDSKADIFSFGLVIYETIALVPPHTLNIDCAEEESVLTEDGNCESSIADDIAIGSSSIDDSSAQEDNLLSRIEGAYGTRPPLPQAFELNDEYNRIVELFYCCTNELAEDRPTAKAIWKSLTDTQVMKQK